MNFVTFARDRLQRRLADTELVASGVEVNSGLNEKFLKEYFKDYLVPIQISDHRLLNFNIISMQYFTL